MNRALVLSFVLIAVFAGGAAAQTCGTSYQVRPGDSLSVIAARQYDNAFLWTDLYAANRDVIGPDPDRIFVGSRLSLPCFGGEEPGAGAPELTEADAAPGPLSDPVAPEAEPAPPEPLIVTQTATLPPFVDDRRAGGGMITELIRNALRAGLPDRDVIFGGPGLVDAALVSDLIFPVIRPECLPGDLSTLCRDFLYSDPLFEMLMVFFVPESAPVPLAGAADLRGKKICRPAGQPVHVLDAGGKNWLAHGLVSIVRAAGTDACFALLDEGVVDTVMLNEFTGRAALAAAGREREIVALSKSPVAIVTLHAAAPQASPRARDVISAFNSGLRDIRATGAFQDILERHMAAVWAGL
ncbi:LysM peptidoglycan-binding domain-containing protein [Roseobacter ponti]|uniref:Transporter substrate-binding domain-containing protein n=1 Tax=Roseobacter ponti TaxID=1891787 RepID=A0A858SWS8_9RHOB|nr:LysM peptidoglycan-binding domain-containing protein [Roseobacter ponti]QJF52083.1 transporter substrate-binding domain-containing protein [Roseobacter ponti]